MWKTFATMWRQHIDRYTVYNIVSIYQQTRKQQECPTLQKLLADVCPTQFRRDKTDCSHAKCRRCCFYFLWQFSIRTLPRVAPGGRGTIWAGRLFYTLSSIWCFCPHQIPLPTNKKEEKTIAAVIYYKKLNILSALINIYLNFKISTSSSQTIPFQFLYFLSRLICVGQTSAKSFWSVRCRCHAQWRPPSAVRRGIVSWISISDKLFFALIRVRKDVNKGRMEAKA